MFKLESQNQRIYKYLQTNKDIGFSFGSGHISYMYKNKWCRKQASNETKVKADFVLSIVSLIHIIVCTIHCSKLSIYALIYLTHCQHHSGWLVMCVFA